MPGQECGRGDGEDVGPSGPWDQRGQGGEPGPVRRFIADSGDLAAQHRILVPQHEDLGHQGAIMRAAVPSTLSTRPPSRYATLSNILLANQ